MHERALLAVVFLALPHACERRVALSARACIDPRPSSMSNDADVADEGAVDSCPGNARDAARCRAPRARRHCNSTSAAAIHQKERKRVRGLRRRLQPLWRRLQPWCPADGALWAQRLFGHLFREEAPLCESPRWAHITRIVRACNTLSFACTVR